MVDQFGKLPIESDGKRYTKFLLAARKLFHTAYCSYSHTVATADRTAASIVKKHDHNTNGCQAFLDLNITYWSQGAQDNAATRAMTQIKEARLTRQTKDGAEGYIQTWEDALDDLDEAERPYYDPLLRKVKFLDGIEDPTYSRACACKSSILTQPRTTTIVSLPFVKPLFRSLPSGWDRLLDNL